MKNAISLPIRDKPSTLPSPSFLNLPVSRFSSKRRDLNGCVRMLEISCSYYPQKILPISAQSLSRGIGGGGIRMQPQTHSDEKVSVVISGVVSGRNREQGEITVEIFNAIDQTRVCRRMKAPCQSGQSPPAIHGEVNVFSANRAAGQLAIRNAQTPATVVGAPRGQPTLD